MKASIYNPYLDTLGGGERYTMAIATILEKNGYNVFVEWSDLGIKEKLEKRFGISLKNINFTKDIQRGEQYDVCFWVSDGSIPALKARKNFIHFQVPFTKVNGKTLLNKMKLFRVRKIVVNSFFTKKFIDKEFGVDSFVLYPPVSVEKFVRRKKENIILNVARFSSLMQAKKQDILIESFKKLYNQGNKKWKLVLAGGSEVGGRENVDRLKEMSRNYPIEILENPTFDNLKSLYGRSKIYWSAAGFGVNEDVNPEKVEHFGITVVEAMSAGCVPIIFNSGGHKEIVANSKNGYLWGTIEGLLMGTKYIIDNEKLWNLFSKNAEKDCLKYNYERFENEFISLL